MTHNKALRLECPSAFVVYMNNFMIIFSKTTVNSYKPV